MTKLLALREQLTLLRRRRRWARWGMAYAALALAVLWSLAAAFGVDYALELTPPQRVVMLVAFAGVVAWSARRFAWPWFGHRENDIDVALMVEKRQKIDGDLVAALQFETPAASAWGSAQLAGAVVERVAELGKGRNIFEGFARGEASRRAMLLAASLAALALLTAVAPRYVGAFLNRFVLGSDHYPSATEIVRVLINGREIDAWPGGDTLLKAAYGQPLKIVVETSGVRPRAGHAELRALDGGLETRVELAPDPLPEPGDRDRGVYAGQLSRLTVSLACQLYMGDAWTDPARVLVVPLPVVEPRLTPIPPDYARRAPVDSAAGSRQLAVIEGTRIDARLACSVKRLRQAWFTIDKVKYPLVKTTAAAGAGATDAAPGEEIWAPAAADTPLSRVDKPIRWEAQVVDEDGLSLERPLEGFIRIKADQRPRILADATTRHVLPTAGPLIEYRAVDDFGLSKLLVRLEKVGPDGSLLELPSQAAGDFREPVLAEHLPLEGSYRLELSPLKLFKGDRLRVVVEAVDYRGSAPGEAGRSEPIVFQVTDEGGVLAAISEADERSARQLDAIITRQLGIGERK